MLYKVEIINPIGEKLTLDLANPHLTGFLVREITGLTPPKANINTTRLSTTDGSIFNSAHLEERNVVFDIVFQEHFTNKSVQDLRLELYKYFPSKKNIEIIAYTDDRVVSTTGYVESKEVAIYGQEQEQSAQISVICPDSFLYSAGPDAETVTVFYGIDPKFEFPYSNESLTEKLTIFGNINNQTEGTIEYHGDSDIGITIYMSVYGDVENVTIYNVDTRESMKINTAKLLQLTGSILIAGDKVIISTIRGKKQATLIRDGTEINILNALDRNTDWFSLTNGPNNFAFLAEEGLSNLEFWITNKTLYEGV